MIISFYPSLQNRLHLSFSPFLKKPLVPRIGPIIIFIHAIINGMCMDLGSLLF